MPPPHRSHRSHMTDQRTKTKSKKKNSRETLRQSYQSSESSDHHSLFTNFAGHCHTHYNLQLYHGLRLQSLCIAQYTVMLPYSSCSRPPCSRIILGADKSTAEQARAAGCIKQSVLPLTMVSVSEGRTKHQKASKLQNEYVRLN